MKMRNLLMTLLTIVGLLMPQAALFANGKKKKHKKKHKSSGLYEMTFVNTTNKEYAIDVHFDAEKVGGIKLTNPKKIKLLPETIGTVQKDKKTADKPRVKSFRKGGWLFH